MQIGVRVWCPCGPSPGYRAMGTGEESTDMWEGHSVSTLGEGGKVGRQAGPPASPEPPGTNRGGALCHGHIPLPLGRLVSEKIHVGTQWMCFRKKAVYALVPQRPTACCHRCGHVCEESARASTPQHVPLQKFMLRNLPAGMPLAKPHPCANPTGREARLALMG